MGWKEIGAGNFTKKPWNGKWGRFLETSRKLELNDDDFICVLFRVTAARAVVIGLPD